MEASLFGPLSTIVTRGAVQAPLRLLVSGTCDVLNSDEETVVRVLEDTYFCDLAFLTKSTPCPNTHRVTKGQWAQVFLFSDIHLQ
jgi:hypothetical protein